MTRAGLGTSYSVPMVSAGAALLWCYDTSLTSTEVRNILISTGTPVEVQVNVFNTAGDANCDGSVDLTDHGLIELHLGETREECGSPFLDSDWDGVITEVDAAAVGYNWDEGA